MATDVVLKLCECGWAVDRRGGRWLHVQTGREQCPTQEESAAWREGRST